MVIGAIKIAQEVRVSMENLLHFPMKGTTGGRRAMTAQPDTDPELGKLLRDLRGSRNLSVKKLARVAGVARKTIDNAEDGLNISLGVLRKLLAALGVEELTFRVDGRHTARASDAIPPEVLQEIAAEIRLSAGKLEKLVAPPALPNAQAERLINTYASLVRSVAGDPQQLAELEHGIETLYASAQGQLPRPARRGRRKRSA
jgi:transcriptional regulator with XRE-family HTH domain